MSTLRSSRGHALIWSLSPGAAIRRPVLTVEACLKWYTLMLVDPNGSVTDVPFPDEWAFTGTPGSAFVDHVPNPSHVLSFANRLRYEIDTLAWEVLVGRWRIEVEDAYPYPAIEA